MRFGFQIPQFGWEAPQLLELWRFLDARESVASLWMMDHLVPPVRGEVLGSACFEAWTLLGAAARETSRIRLGCLVSANTFRHPALLAKMALTVDHLSGGRLTLGLGAGWFEEEHRIFGLALPPIPERLDRLEESARLLRAALAATAPVSLGGRHYRLDRAPFAPRSRQVPGLPLLIGGDGERRTLAIVARHADVANFQGPVSAVRHKLEVLRRHCEAIGRSDAEIRKTVHVPIDIVQEPGALQTAREFLSRHLSISARQAREEIPVGSPEQVRDVLEAYAELGITEAIRPQIGPMDRRSFELLERRVLGPLCGSSS